MKHSYVIIFKDGLGGTEIVDHYEHFMDAYSRVKAESKDRGLELADEFSDSSGTTIETFFIDDAEGEEWVQYWIIKKI